MTDAPSGQRVCPECIQLTDARTCPHDGSITIPAENITVDGADPRIGRVLAGRYKIERKLGSGGMGSVYLAEQVPIGRKVALKFLHRRLMSDITAVKRFQREARAVATLGHPNTIKLHDFGQTEDDELYLAMEYLEGEPLSDLMERESPLSTEVIISVVSQVLQSLSEAHARGFVHRDIKPQNLFVCDMLAHSGKLLKVLDFGVAKMVEGEETTLTATGVAVGSPRYMAPEQIRALPVCPQTDLYALGGVIFEMLTRRPLFIRSNSNDLVMAHVKADPPPPIVHGKELAGPLVEFMFACLEKLPEDRPLSAAAALQELASMGARPVHCTDGTPYPPPSHGADEALPPATVQLHTQPQTVVHRPGHVQRASASASDLQRIPSVAFRTGDETRDGGLQAHASTLESDPSLPAAGEGSLPSDFARVPSVMWKRRPGDEPTRRRPTGIATTELAGDDPRPTKLLERRDEASRPAHEPKAIDPELHKGTIPPPDMLPQGAPPRPAPSTPAIAFTKDDFDAAEAKRTPPSRAPRPEPDTPTREKPNNTKIYLIVGIASALLAVIVGIIAASI